MTELNNAELYTINGGAVKLAGGISLIGVGVITFLIGVVNGIKRPLSCSSK